MWLLQLITMSEQLALTVKARSRSWHIQRDQEKLTQAELEA
jgi:hypothetical protein